MWTDEEDEQLRALVAEYGVKKWALISTKMAAKGAKQCRRRWQNYLNNDIKQGGWSEEEDAGRVGCVGEMANELH